MTDANYPGLRSRRDRLLAFRRVTRYPRWPVAARLGYPVVLCCPIVKKFLTLHTTNQPPLMLDDGGSGLLEERNAASPDRTFCTVGTFRRLLYIQRNITDPNVLTKTQLITPTPRNMFMVQVSRGK